ncbi:MAG: membrane protein DedA with SNARE-associated domain [Limimaricola cinnabarinus]|jgi:membrane protein DedA with SNARE-associated domain|uniref:DedA family protein n=1 Tax=Limimaricola cinnabarinus LL-001 TaxID=1337093 RepID=U2YYY5_9RHOB|nr:DedA family protein [Limimaricola cinnabarinus]GAD54032.1 dedA family protein [Limimaricola cinnabarinus LL-001]
MFDFITSWIAAGGAFAVAALMFLENVFPPIPSELVMPLAGYNAATGEAHPALTLIAGLIGSVAGAWIWYEVGRRLGRERLMDWVDRHGRWLTLSREDVEKALGWFERHGAAAIFFGRMIPTVRTLISVPAGIQGMGMVKFLAYTTAGSLIWVGALFGAGYLLEAQYERVQGWLNPVTNGILGVIVLLYLWRVFRGKGRRKES